MYMDGVVAYGIVIVLATCAVVWYVGRYAYRHFKRDCEAVEHPEASAK